MKELRPAIIRMHQRGIPKREISRLDIPLTTVFKDIKRYEETGTNEDRPRRGRRRTSRTPANRRRARGMISRNPTTKRNSKAKKSLYLLNHISLNGSYIYEKCSRSHEESNDTKTI